MRSSTRSLTALAAIAMLALTACGSETSTSSPAPSESALLGTTGPIGAADETALKSNLRTVATEMETLYTEYLAYPSTIVQNGRMLTLDTATVTLDEGITITGSLLNAGTQSAGYCLTASAPGAPTTTFNSVTGGIGSTPCPA